jgi:anaerobic selenocysteine-containing dehydrogenase
MKRTIGTHCGRMDHGGCGLLVDVDDGRITGIRPDPAGPLSHGHICPKALALKELHEHPDRLKRPLVRVGDRGSGQWREIGWDEALDRAVDGFNRIRDRYGARAVAFCQGAPKGLEHFLLIRLANTFGSPNVVGPQNVCHMPREMAGIHTCGFYPIADYDHPTAAVLVWGSNLTATNEEGVINVRLLDRLKADDPPLIVVDPRKTDLARRAHIWLPVRPGTDLALALGMIHVVIREELFDRAFVDTYTHGFDELSRAVADFGPERAAGLADVPVDDLVRAARLFGKARPGMIQWGNGIEQDDNNFDTARALIALMALGGNLEAPGGNVAASAPPVVRLGDFVRGDRLPDRAKAMISAGRVVPGFVVVPPELFKKAVKESDPYPVRGAYVHVSNPVLAWSDSRDTWETLQKLDFLAVAETFLSPTAALADLVLPAATQLECDDLGHFGLAHGFLLARPKVVDPPGDARPLSWILNQLGRRLTSHDLWWDNEGRMLDDLLAPAGLTYANLAQKGILRGRVRYHGYRDKGFKTPTGKVELALSKADKMGLAPAPRWNPPADAAPSDAFPWLLTGHKSRNYFCSDHRWLEAPRKREPDPLVLVHPHTALQAGVTDGEWVRVETESGGIRVKVRVTDDVRPGVLSVVHGWWRPGIGAHQLESFMETSLNVLTSGDRLGPALATPRLRAIPARLSPSPGESDQGGNR